MSRSVLTAALGAAMLATVAPAPAFAQVQPEQGRLWRASRHPARR
ncbi:MAG: hypothetical protein ACK45V_00340 [Brevundimonas sp.]